MSDIRNYELTVVLAPDSVTEDAKTDSRSIVLALVEKHGGKVVATDEWGEKVLAYPIRKYDKAYYVVYAVDFPANTAGKFETELRHITPLLRWLFVTREAKQ